MEVEALPKEKPPLGTFPNKEAPFSCSRQSWFLDDLSASLKRAGEGFFWFSAASTTLFPDGAFMISDFDSSEGDFLISLIPFLVLIMSATAFSISSKRSGSSSGTASAFVSSTGSSGLSIELSMDAEVTDRWYWNFMISIIRSISGILPAFMTMKFSMNLSLHISIVSHSWSCFSIMSSSSSRLSQPSIDTCRISSSPSIAVGSSFRESLKSR